METIETIRAEDSESLSKKVVHGGIWVFSLRLVNRGLGFIRTIILARLLAPEDFGLLGIGMLSIATIETFSQTGFGHALIQKREDIDSYLDTAWTVSVIRGIVLFLILFVSAPLIAKFFNSNQATLVIRFIAISTLITGFKNIGVLFFFKKLEFNKQFIYELSGTLFDLSVAITLAFILRNVWALIWGGLAGNLIRLFMSYILHPYRPKLKIEKSKAKDLFCFGKWIVGSGIIGFLINQGDDIFVGKMLGITALGVYQMAFVLSNSPATEITHVVSQVTFPAYSKLKNNIPKLRNSYLKVLQLTMFFSAPLCGAIFILSPEFTQLVMGDKWMPIVPVMKILVFAGLIRALAGVSGIIFYAVGKPKIDTILQIARLTVLVALIYPFTINFGLTGLSVAVLLSIFITNIGYGLIAINITKCCAKEFSKKIIIPFLNGSVAVITTSMLKDALGGGILELIVLAIFFASFYFLLSYLSEKLFDYKITVLFKDIYSSIRTPIMRKN
jgi:O-antigen/teichoic acid export membrane protein